MFTGYQYSYYNLYQHSGLFVGIVATYSLTTETPFQCFLFTKKLITTFKRRKLDFSELSCNTQLLKEW